MKTVLILALLCAIIPFTYAGPAGFYQKTTIACSLSDPGSPATGKVILIIMMTFIGWVYCVEQANWFKTDCGN